MTITILTPEGNFIGPNIQITTVSDAIGPIPPGATLGIDFYQVGGEVLTGRWDFPVSSNVSFHVLDLEHLNPGPYQAVLQPMTGVTIQTHITSSAGTFDSGTTTGLTWTTEGQIAQTLKELHDLVSTGGFTSDDRAQLATVDTNVVGLLTGVFSELPGFAGQLVNNIIGSPSPGLVTRSLIGDFTECGALTRPAFGAEVDAFGLAWEVVTYGGGVGLDASVPQRFEPWLLDLELRHTDHDGHEYTSGTASFDYSNGYWFFQPVLPARVNYCILPSATLRFYWLLVTL